MVRLAALLSLLALLAPSTAPAAAPVVVLYEPGDDPEGARARVQTSWRLQKGRFALRLAEFRPIGGVLPDHQELFALGALSAEPCADHPVPPEAFEGLVVDSAGALAWLEFDEADATLERARAVLPCLSGVADPVSLARYHLVRGVTAFYGSGPEASRDEFRRGLLVSPFLQWDPDYPPAAEVAFREAVGDALRTGRGMLGLAPGVFGGGSLWIDGVPVDPRMRTRDLFAGTHLLQWRGQSGEWVTLHAGIGEGEEAALVHRADLLRTLVTRGGDPLALSWLDDRLTEVEEDVEEVVVAEAGKLVLFHRFDPKARSWRNAIPEELEFLMIEGRRRRSGGIAIGLSGAALFLIGSGMLAGAVALLGEGSEADVLGGISGGMGLTLVVVGTTGMVVGGFAFGGGDQMARGRDRQDYLRYQGRAVHGRSLGAPAAPVEP